MLAESEAMPSRSPPDRLAPRRAVLEALRRLAADAERSPADADYRLLWAMIEYVERESDRRAAEQLAELCDALVDWEEGARPEPGVAVLAARYVALLVEVDD